MHLLASTGPVALPVVCFHQISRDGKTKADKRGYHVLDDFAECFDDQTEIMAESGWKLFKDLEPQERVATRTSDGKLEYQVPTKYIVEPYEGPLYTYDSYHLNFAVTPNHRMLVGQAWDRDKPPALVEMRSLRSERYWTPRTVTPNVVCENRIMSFVRESDPYRSGPRCKPVLPSVLMTDFAAFVGFWLAEGAKNCRGWGVKVTQSKAQGVEWVDNLLARMNWEAHRSESSKEVSWYISSPELQKYLMKLCVGDGQRPGDELVLPDGWTSWSYEEQSALLEGLLMGDGSFSTKEQRFDYFLSTSKKLVDDVQRLLIHLGKIGNVGMNYDAGRPFISTNGKEYKSRVPGYRVRIDSSRQRGNAYLYPSKVKIVSYSGMIYCLQVPNQTLLVRRQGVPMWTGNSSEVERSASIACTLYQNHEDRIVNEALLQIVAARRVDLKAWDINWVPSMGYARSRGEHAFNYQ
jgi:replicative DNA helicase Mcm